MAEGENIVWQLRRNAEAFPDRCALAFEDAATKAFVQRTYREIEAASDACAFALLDRGIIRGMRTVIMVPPGPELFTLLLALFKIGAVPVVVDPGMGIGRMLDCYRTVQAQGFIGVPITHLVRRLARRTFRAITVPITVGRGGLSFDAADARGAFPIADVSADDPLMINFTTGSTGPPKGVDCTHGMAAAMVRGVAEVLRPPEAGVGLVTLPLLAIVDLLLGCTAVLAPMDVTRPANADPARLLDAARRFAVTHLFASPALLDGLAAHCHATGTRLPDSLTALASGGAPVRVAIVQATRAALPEGARLETTYGATEALPIATLGADEILAETAARTAKGAGTCVGRPVGDLRARVIAITDDAIADWSHATPMPAGGVGEIIIAGPVVSPRYPFDATADAMHKIADDGIRWHRTGDVGFLDDAGRLWFGGRKSQRVETAAGPRFTVQVEGVFNAHPDVHRAALVGVPSADASDPVVCIELHRPADAATQARVCAELAALAETTEVTRGLSQFLIHPGFPVDIRHNAKIGREELAAWATRRLGRAPPARGLWLRAVPIGGWLFLLLGLLLPFEHPALWAIWWIDAFLSVIVHGIQLVPALPRGRRAGYPRWQTVLYTFLFGATWWKRLDPPTASPPRLS